MFLIAEEIPSQEPELLQLLAKSLKAVERLDEGFVFFGEVEADQVIHRFAEEAGARHCRDAHFLRQIQAELVIGFIAEFADIHHHEVRALGFGELESEILEATREDILHVGVMGLQFLVVIVTEIEGGQSRFL